ncbi:MAG: bifunctional riboflavin kinase/FAD synthetase [Christensenellales bacterium]
MKLITNDVFRYNEEKQAVVVLGMFDGVHMGHQTLIEKAKVIARENDAITFVYSFYNHPQSVLKPQDAPLALMTPQEKIRFIASLGVDYLALVPFSFQLSEIPAVNFIDSIFKQISVKAIVAGYNYRFGAGGKGDKELLQKRGAEFGAQVHIIDAVVYKGEPISSTRIRQALLKGNIPDANAMLGREYSIAGKIVEGKMLARELGFPTANFQMENKVLPQNGVYLARVFVRGNEYNAVVNTGKNPTVENSGNHMEAHLLNCDKDLYGEAARIVFLERVRDEIKFPSVEALKDQIAKDVAFARQYFLKYRA